MFAPSFGSAERLCLCHRPYLLDGPDRPSSSTLILCVVHAVDDLENADENITSFLGDKAADAVLVLTKCDLAKNEVVEQVVKPVLGRHPVAKRFQRCLAVVNRVGDNDFSAARADENSSFEHIIALARGQLANDPDLLGRLEEFQSQVGIGNVLEHIDGAFAQNIWQWIPRAKEELANKRAPEQAELDKLGFSPKPEDLARVLRLIEEGMCKDGIFAEAFEPLKELPKEYDIKSLALKDSIAGNSSWDKVYDFVEAIDKAFECFDERCDQVLGQRLVDILKRSVRQGSDRGRQNPWRFEKTMTVLIDKVLPELLEAKVQEVRRLVDEAKRQQQQLRSIPDFGALEELLHVLVIRQVILPVLDINNWLEILESMPEEERRLEETESIAEYRKKLEERLRLDPIGASLQRLNNLEDEMQHRWQHLQRPDPQQMSQDPKPKPDSSRKKNLVGRYYCGRLGSYFCTKAEDGIFSRACLGMCGPFSDCQCTDCLLATLDEGVEPTEHQAAAKTSRPSPGEFLVDGKAEFDTEWSLHVAATKGDIVRLAYYLGKEGISADQQDRRGLSPLHWAAANGQIEAARLLLSRGASVDFLDSKCRTPLHRAASGGHAHVAQLLLSNGAAMHAKDTLGLSPFQAAMTEEMKAVFKSWIRLGA